MSGTAMSAQLDPALERDLTEARSDVARHGIVIIRGIETELAPALVSEARRSMASSPRKLAQMDDEELDRYTEKVRKAAMKAAGDLAGLYTRLLAKLGAERVDVLAKEIEGIGQLMTWDRIAQSAEAVNDHLAEKGFGKIQLEGPEALSDAFEVELEEKWPRAFKRLEALVHEGARLLAQEGAAEPRAQMRRKRNGSKR